jgi:hypothetical protein
MYDVQEDVRGSVQRTKVRDDKKGPLGYDDRREDTFLFFIRHAESGDRDAD